MPNKTVSAWFDHLEVILDAEARLSGLLQHASTIGTAREFLITRVLRTILPPSVHIGLGKVIDSLGGQSKQIDIIIYDPRFPLMKVDGGGLYPVEGVLATIEVKSSLDSAELVASLENTKSVLLLQPSGQCAKEAEASIQNHMKIGNLSHNDAERRFWYMYRPATYTFAFTSKLSLHSTGKCIIDWWTANDCGISNHFPLLPRIISSGNVVGVVNDGRLNLTHSSGIEHVMALFSTTKRFRWFAAHIMDSVSRRLGLRNFAENFDYDINAYFPWDGYHQEIKSSSTIVIRRERRPLGAS